MSTLIFVCHPLSQTFPSCRNRSELGVKKIFLLLLIVAAFALLVPDSRETVVNWAGSVGGIGQRRSAERALEEIAADVRREADETGAFPRTGSLASWLEGRDRPTGDPWGSSYYFALFADSFVVGSPGPDARLGTADDVRLAQRRVVPEPGALIIDHQPAPPPSSAKNTAKSKALEAAGRR